MECARLYLYIDLSLVLIIWDPTNLGGLGASRYPFRFLYLLMILELAMAFSAGWEVCNAYRGIHVIEKCRQKRVPGTQEHCCTPLLRPFYDHLIPSEILYTSVCNTIFSLSGFLGTWPFLLCFLSFSTLLFKAASSSALISPAFFTCFGNLLCL